MTIWEGWIRGTYYTSSLSTTEISQTGPAEGAVLGQKSDLAEDDVAGAHHQQVALEAATDLLLNAVVHVRRVVGVTLVNEDLLRQLDGQAVPVYGCIL